MRSTRWAMGGLGSIAFDTDEEQPFLGYEISQGRAYNETTAAQIDNEVVDLLNRCHQNACDLLNQMRTKEEPRLLPDKLDVLRIPFLYRNDLG